ncbi:type IV pilus assembly protein PilM [Sporomusa aerivorans]|uniref:type IV pilus assembly protein PilM n=1 Tax=Sporomusa aerivorans TaxID=204936 RepID=UPI00352BA1D6
MMLPDLSRYRIRLSQWLKQPPANIVGIDIGTGCIKAVEIALIAGQPVLKAAGLTDLPPGLIENGYVAKPAELAATISSLLTNSGIVSRNVVVAVSGSAVFVREVILPAMSIKELKEAIKWDMEKYIPFAPDSYYHDFAIAGQGENETELRVLLVAAPRRLVDSLTGVLTEAACQTIAVDIEALALSRTLSGSEDANTVILDIGKTVSRVIVFQESIPVITRFLPIGGQNFTEIIMQSFTLEYTEAERVKQYPAGQLNSPISQGEVSAVARRFEELVTEFAREVRRTLEYLQLQNRKASIERVYLTGGGTKLEILHQHLSEHIGDIVLLKHKPLAGISLSQSIDKRFLHDFAPQLAVAIGLAMYRGSYDYN